MTRGGPETLISGKGERAAPDYINRKLQAAHNDYEFQIRNQMINQWGLNTFDDLHFKYLVDQGKRSFRTDPITDMEVDYLDNMKRMRRGGESSSQHEAMDDYLKRMNPFGNRRDPIG